MRTIDGVPYGITAIRRHVCESEVYHLYFSSPTFEPLLQCQEHCARHPARCQTVHGANTSLALSVNPACELCERMATLHLPLYHKIGEDVHAHGSCVCYTAPARSCWHSCSQRLFDGLGHFLENLLVDTVHNLAENEAADTCPPNAIFPEVLNSNTMYLEGVGGQADAIL